MLLSLAVDYHAADVATRERFHVSQTRVAPLYARLSDDGITEMVLVATCNRTELYAWCPAAAPDDVAGLYRTLARRWMPKSADAAALLKIAVRRADLAASRHAMRVTAGLESLVLGDGQILGQVRRAYMEATAEHATGPVLHRMFESALRAGKRVQATTQLGSGKNSVGAQAAALCVRRFGQLTHTRIVILGCGKTGERVARQLSKFGARDLVFVNRSEARAQELARELSGRSAPIETAHVEIAMSDIAIVATGSEVPIVLADRLAQARANCATNRFPLLLVDLSMPRNVDFSAAALEGVTLVDLDALQPQVTATEQQRRSAVPLAEAVVETELQEFADWLTASRAREAIRPLRDVLAEVCRKELSHATDEVVAERLVKRIVAKVMARPMTAVRGAVARGEPVNDLTRTLMTLFAMPAYDALPATAQSLSMTE